MVALHGQCVLSLELPPLGLSLAFYSIRFKHFSSSSEIIPRGAHDSLSSPAFPLSYESLKGFQAKDALQGDVCFFLLFSIRHTAWAVLAKEALNFENSVGRAREEMMA